MIRRRDAAPARADEAAGMAARIRRQAANAITFVRVLATPAFACAVWSAHGADPSARPLLIFAVVVGSDLADGPVARRLAIASEPGRIFDHVADIVFIVAGLAVYAHLGVVPWWVPGAIAASFAFYVVDSRRRRRPGGAARLIGSRLGHAAGVCNYAVIGVVAGNESLGLHWLPAALMGALFALVPIYSAAAVAVRLLPARRAGAATPP